MPIAPPSPPFPPSSGHTDCLPAHLFSPLVRSPPPPPLLSPHDLRVRTPFTAPRVRLLLNLAHVLLHGSETGAVEVTCATSSESSATAVDEVSPALTLTADDLFLDRGKPLATFAARVWASTVACHRP